MTYAVEAAVRRLHIRIAHYRRLVLKMSYVELDDLGDRAQSTLGELLVGEEIEHAESGPRAKLASFSPHQLHLVLLKLGVISDSAMHVPVEETLEFLPPDTLYMMDRIQNITIDESLGVLREALVEHKGDVNFLKEDYNFIHQLVAMIPQDSNQEPPNDEEKLQHVSDWNLQVRIEAALIKYHSPYPEIRAITDPTDDPHVPVATIRAYSIGLFWTLIGSIINNFFVHRLPSISLGPHTVQLLLLPTGRLWERYMPEQITVRNWTLELNPGSFTAKEMMLSTIMYSCSAGTPYLIYNIFVMKLERFYNLKWVTPLFQVLLIVSTQFLGFGFAGIMRKVCIYPQIAIWPTILPTIALNRALITPELPNSPPINGWRISRYRFFFVVFVASFLYNWIPSYLFTALSYFNWPTWFRPNLVHLNNIAGFKHGLGLNPIPSFDWNMLNSGLCLTLPYYTYINSYAGAFLGFLVILGVYYTNNKWSGYFPINSNQLFNNKGQVYNVHDILDSKNAFDSAKYNEVGPPYFSAANLVLYGAHFCLYPFAILYHFVTEWDSMKTSFLNVWDLVTDFRSTDAFGKYREDAHCKMMSKYQEVPNWWFLAILCVSVVCAILCVSLYPTETPVWGVFLTIGINFLFLIPITAIASVTGFTFGLNVLVELLVGYCIPNSGIALITLKCYGYNIDSQASNYITDQKIAHYAKIPPRAIFKGQMLATGLSVAVALIIANWQIYNVADICDIDQKDRFSCPGANTYFYSSIQYGEIGPAKVFSGLYPQLKWCFLLGAVLVVPCAWLKKKLPTKYSRYFHPTIIIGGFLLYAPYNLLYFTGGLYLSYYFMHRIKGRYLQWWEKYNYLLTSALSAGVAFSALMIFFTVQYNGDELNWWGNNVSSQGIEGGKVQATWLKAENAPDGYIGLRKGQFP